MKEFLTANNSTFECISVTTGLDCILITMSSENYDPDVTRNFFKTVTELTLTMEGETEPHGVYTEPDFSLAFKSIEEFEDGTFIIKMHIKNEIEKRLDALEASQALQDGAIIDLAQTIGGEE